MSWRHVSSTFIPGWMRARTSYRPDLIPSSLSKEGPTSALKSDACTKTGGGDQSDAKVEFKHELKSMSLCHLF